MISPCAYVVGLLDAVVIADLELERHGYRVTPADPNLWCPFEDGTSYAGFIDGARTAESPARAGFRRRRHRRAWPSSARSSTGSANCCARGAAGDSWQAPVADRDEIEGLLGDDRS